MVDPGTTVTFNVAVNGALPMTYQWRKNGAGIAGATGTTLTLTNVQPEDAGSYSVTASNRVGTVISNPANLTVGARLTNVSVRSTAGAGAETLIVGFNISGTGNKQVLLRGVGPTLSEFGVTGMVADPQLRLFSSAPAEINQNDDWGGDTPLAGAFASVGAFELPRTSRDAALLVSLPAGSYTAHLASASGAGIALVEGYDSDASSAATRLTNISVRSIVGTGDNVLIVGFAITGASSKTLLIRGVGPTLAGLGVADVLSDPQLRLFNSGGVQINQNDNWGGSGALSAAFVSVAAFELPGASRDAVLLVTLAPGSYTAQLSGVNDATGVALVEVYDVP
jgi:hypothetical protein